jgi:hypothetical protein
MEGVTRCFHHNVVEPCDLCRRGLWSLRDLHAVADFAGRPVDRPDGLVPELKYIRLSAVIRSIGRRWSEIERVKQTILRPIYATKNALVRESKIGAIDVGRLEKAAGAVARGETTSPDRVVASYMECILKDEVPW